MTTIAYKDGVIAYDSRTMANGIIVTDQADKHIISHGVHFFMTGNVCDINFLIEAYRNNERSCKGYAEAVIVDAGQLRYINMEPDGTNWHDWPHDDCRAIGSGQHFAYTAMDMGATAKEAVQMAMKRDPATGGRVRSFRI